MDCFLNRIIIGGGTTPTPTGYVRPTGVPNGESIIANAPIIESGGVNYYPIYYICAMDTFTGTTFSKTGTGVSTGADAFVFSDEPSTLYVGDTAHTFDVADDFATDQEWKCRYVIMYATEANKNDSAGITVNLYMYRAIFEIIGGQYLKLSSTSAVSGYTSSTTANKNLRYVNLENSSFYNNELSVSDFCRSCYSLATLTLPILTTISGGNFCYYCYSLTTLTLPNLTTSSGGSFCSGCHSLVTLTLPNLTTYSSGGYFCCNCYSLEYFVIPSTITSMTDTSVNTLNFTQFIELPTDFDITGCNFTGETGYPKSLAWFTHLATQLKDNSGGTAKTMVLGATNIALIPSATATIISNKNWTLS